MARRSHGFVCIGPKFETESKVGSKLGSWPNIGIQFSLKNICYQYRSLISLSDFSSNCTEGSKLKVLFLAVISSKLNVLVSQLFMLIIDVKPSEDMLGKLKAIILSALLHQNIAWWWGMLNTTICKWAFCKYWELTIQRGESSITSYTITNW